MRDAKYSSIDHRATTERGLQERSWLREYRVRGARPQRTEPSAKRHSVYYYRKPEPHVDSRAVSIRVYGVSEIT